MGYYIRLEAADFTIPTENLDEAFERLKALNKNDSLKTGGSWGPGGQSQAWFAWMPPNYDEIAKSAADIFEMLGFEVELDDAGLLLQGYDSKAGNEDHFLDAIASLVKPGSFLEWRGEEGAMWRDEFDGTVRTTKQARIVWE